MQRMRMGSIVLLALTLASLAALGYASAGLVEGIATLVYGEDFGALGSIEDILISVLIAIAAIFVLFPSATVLLMRRISRKTKKDTDAKGEEPEGDAE